MCMKVSITWTVNRVTGPCKRLWSPGYIHWRFQLEASEHRKAFFSVCFIDPPEIYTRTPCVPELLGDKNLHSECRVCEKHAAAVRRTRSDSLRGRGQNPCWWSRSTWSVLSAYELRRESSASWSRNSWGQNWGPHPPFVGFLLHWSITFLT